MRSASARSARRPPTGYSASASGEFLKIVGAPNARFSIVIKVTDATGATDSVIFIGDFGTSTVRDVGVHDSVFNAQDLDTAKWNTNANGDIGDATTVPHVTVLGTGDGNADFYSFEITQDMLIANGGNPIRVTFDIDHGYDIGDSQLWRSSINLYKLVPPLDPSQPTLPTLIGQSPANSFSSDPGSTYVFDGFLSQTIDTPGTYYVEVTAIYPAGLDGVPAGVDYQLNVSIEQHAQDSFLFAPSPVGENEGGNSSGTGQVIDTPDATTGKLGQNFFTFFDPNVGNLDSTGATVNAGQDKIDFSTPYVRIRGTGDFSYDIYQFTAKASPASLAPISASSPTDTGFGSTPVPYYTSASYKLTGAVTAGDTWKLGIGYRDYSYTAIANDTLWDVATALAKAINDARTAGTIDAGYVASVTPVVEGSGAVATLTVTDAAGFTLLGSTAAKPAGIEDNVNSAGTVTRTTTAKDTGTTPADIAFSNVKIDLDTTGFDAADKWYLTLNDTHVTAEVSGTDLNNVAANLRTAVTNLGLAGVTVVVRSDDIVEINSTTGVTVGVSTRGVDPKGSAKIVGTPFGQPVVGDLTAQEKLIDWATVTVDLGAAGTPHEHEVWSLTVGATLKTHTVGAGEAADDIADDLATKFGGITGLTVGHTVGSNVITFTFASTFVGNGTINFSISRAVTAGTISATGYTGLAVLDLSTLNGTTGGKVASWSLQIGAAGPFTATVAASKTTTINNLIAAIGGGYTAEYDSTGDRLVIYKATGGTFTATLVETYSNHTASDTVSSTNHNDAVFDLSNFAGDSRAVQWSLTLPGVASPLTKAVSTSLSLSGTAFAAYITSNSGGNYSASFNTGNNRLTVTRTDSGPSNWPSSQTLTVTETGNTKTVADNSNLAGAIVTLGGSVGQGETWEVDFGATPASFPVPGTGTTTTTQIATGLSGTITGLGFTSFVSSSGKIIVRGAAANVVTAQPITTPVVTGAVTLSGTVDLSWTMTVKPNSYPEVAATGDVWTLTVAGTTVSYTVPGTVTDFPGLLNFLVASLNADTTLTSAHIHAAIHQTAGVDDGIDITSTNGSSAALSVGALKLKRVQPYDDTASPQAADTTQAHYTQVVFQLDNAQFQAVSAGDVYEITLNGKTYKYTVGTGLLEGTEAGERNLNTVAAGIVKLIHDDTGFLLDAEVLSLGSAGIAPKIRIFDRAAGAKDTVVFGAKTGGEVHIVADIDNTRLVTGSFDVLTGYTPVVAYYETVFTGEFDFTYIFPIPIFVQVPVYIYIPTFETVHYTVSPRLELLDDTGTVVASSEYNPSAPGSVDPGSASAFDPLLDFTAQGLTSAGRKYTVRVSSVITYDKFFPQYEYPGVYSGISYDLIISVPGHDTNANALDLTGKTLQVSEGSGAGEAGKIVDYDPETKAYYLSVNGAGFDNWADVPGLDSSYDITSLMSASTNPYNSTYLHQAPVTDTFSVVLTKAPGSSVIVNVLPTATRTYDADEAFNPDAAFGENTANQVRVATNRALIQFSETAAAPSPGEYWIVTLTGTLTTLSVKRSPTGYSRRCGSTGRSRDSSPRSRAPAAGSCSTKWLPAIR